MICQACGSLQQRTFNGEVAIHFSGWDGLNKPIVWVFPKLRVCLDCGFTQFKVSERELEVLRLLGTELSGPELARKLMVSVNTLRTHTKNIYNKLGVNNRQAAFRRARELDLL